MEEWLLNHPWIANLVFWGSALAVAVLLSSIIELVFA